MKHKSKILILVLSFTMLLSFTSCSNDMQQMTKNGRYAVKKAKQIDKWRKSIEKDQSLKKKVKDLKKNAEKTGKKAEKTGKNKADSIRKKAEQKSNIRTDIPDYPERGRPSGESVIKLNRNNPKFTKKELSQKNLEKYSNLDSLGRCGPCIAMVSKKTMPTAKRGSIGMIKPSGWHTIRYDFVDGKYLYNRCHLIGYQLTGQNANPKNLITGTRSFNTSPSGMNGYGGMLYFENKIADYIKNTNHHVLYRVTPYFKGNELVARGVQMEAKSIEDNKISFNVFVYNVEPGVKINYMTGDSHAINNRIRLSYKKNKNTTGKLAAISSIYRDRYSCPGFFSP